MKPRECSDIEAALLAGRDLDERQRRHLADCRPCRDLQLADARLRQLGDWHRRFDGERLPALSTAARPAVHRWRLVAVAAAVLLLVGAGLWWGAGTGRSLQPERQVAEQLFALLDDIDQVTQPSDLNDSDDQASGYSYLLTDDYESEPEVLALPRSLQALELIVGEVTL